MLLHVPVFHTLDLITKTIETVPRQYTLSPWVLTTCAPMNRWGAALKALILLPPSLGETTGTGGHFRDDMETYAKGTPWNLWG